jgi:hypothetical protein
LFARVASIAQQENRTFIKWAVLDWNQPAIDMYKALGADFMDDWRTAMLEGEGLRRLAEKES